MIIWPKPMIPRRRLIVVQETALDLAIALLVVFCTLGALAIFMGE